MFRLTSSFNGSGIDDLFTAIGKKFLDPSFSEDNPVEKKDTLKIGKDDGKEGKGKKGCC